MTAHLLAGAVAATVLAASLLVVLIVLRQATALHRLRLMLDQTQAGIHSEAEITRAATQATSRDSADRLATVRAAFDIGIEQMRAVLGREQGELRLALADAQRRQDEQVGRQFEALRGVLEARLREMREGNEAKLAEIRKTVNEQLHAAVEKQMTESFNRVVDQFAAVQKAMGDVRAVTEQIGDIKRLFSNVKTRGGWGETQVRAMLDDILPPGAWQANCKVRPDSDELVEFAVSMPMRGVDPPLLPIDAKFPVEDYERLLAASASGDADAERMAARGLERRVREEARKIAAKYICPPATVEFAVLYVPTDSLYTEIARIPGLIDEIGREARVLLMGPTLFPALLRTIHLGFITLTLEQKADQIRDLLGATRTEMLKMDDVLGRLARQAGTFSNTIERARQRTRAVSRKLRSVEAVGEERAERLLELGCSVDELEEAEAEAESLS